MARRTTGASRKSKARAGGNKPTGGTRGIRRATVPPTRPRLTTDEAAGRAESLPAGVAEKAAFRCRRLWQTEVLRSLASRACAGRGADGDAEGSRAVVCSSGRRESGLSPTAPDTACLPDGTAMRGWALQRPSISPARPGVTWRAVEVGSSSRPVWGVGVGGMENP